MNPIIKAGRSLGLASLVAATAVLGISAVSTNEAHAGTIKVKSLKIEHRTRGRPIVVVRLVNGRWQVKSSHVVHFDLKVEIRSKTNRILSADFILGGNSYNLYRGKLTWKLRWKKFTGGFAGGQLGSDAAGAAKACGKLMKGRNGSARFHYKIKVTFRIGDKKGHKASASKFVSAFLDCKR
jgi:hypothetical protein